MTITHRKGELFALSSGEYSDYRFNGLYRALKDVNLAELAAEYYAQCPKTSWGGVEATDYGWGAYLIAHGHAEEIPYDEVHCGSYNFEVEDVAEHCRAAQGMPDAA